MCRTERVPCSLTVSPPSFYRPYLGDWSNFVFVVCVLVGDALSGLISVRAYGAEEKVRAEAIKRVDLYSRATVTFYNLVRLHKILSAESIRTVF